MTTDLINICYEGSSGTNDIRTTYIDGILYLSLQDVFATLNKENRILADQPARYIPNLIQNQVKDLDDDEFCRLPHPNPTKGLEHEVFITQPGLNRVMGSNKSPAGKKFQRWLYHEVVPSLSQHGVYPPPEEPKGSALSQLAEQLAQNTRVLADTIHKQEVLEQDVHLVKQDVGEVKNEVQGVEKRVAKLESGAGNNEFILTVSSWFEKKNAPISQNQEESMVNWCENLSLIHNKPIQRCPSGNRLKSAYYMEVIEEAHSLVFKL